MHKIQIYKFWLHVFIHTRNYSCVQRTVFSFLFYFECSIHSIDTLNARNTLQLRFTDKRYRALFIQVEKANEITECKCHTLIRICNLLFHEFNETHAVQLINDKICHNIFSCVFAHHQWNTLLQWHTWKLCYFYIYIFIYINIL